MNLIHWDHNATTPTDARVLQAMEPFLREVWGNPSSIHALGRRARAALDEFRYRLAGLWRCRPSEVVFTGGGTESTTWRSSAPPGWAAAGADATLSPRRSSTTPCSTR